MSKVFTTKKNHTDENLFTDRTGLVYVRVSSKKQEIEGHGRQSQEGRCLSKLESLGVPYERSFPDTYTGGGDFMNRPAMREMLAYIDARPHKKFVVIFDDLKRFARDTAFHLQLRTAFKSRDIVLQCLNYNFDDSPEGMFVETILAAGNELERHQNRRQVVQKMRARMEAGYWPFGGKKGYDIGSHPEHGKIAIPNKQGLEMLKPAMEGFANGNLQRKIDVCRFLVERGFWKKQSPEKYIDKLDAMLRDPFYCGDIEYPQWEVSRRRGKQKGIITPEVHAKIQRRLEKDGATGRIRTDITDDFKLRGLLICAECRSPLTAAWSKGCRRKYPYYFCQKKGCVVRSKALRRDDVEDEFKEMLGRNRLRAQVEKVLVPVFSRVWKQEARALEWNEQVAALRKSELEQKVSELTQRILKAQSEAVQRAYEIEIEKATREIEQLDRPAISNADLSVPYRTALEKVTGMLKNPVSIWDSVDVHEKHRLFFFLFEAKLPYSKIASYRTGDSLSTARLFEEFVVANSQDVDMVLERLNWLKAYLSRFWEYYESSPTLQKQLEITLRMTITGITP